MKIFDSEDYRPFVSWKISQYKIDKKSLSLSSVALRLKMDPSLLTRILRNERGFTLDQGYLFSEQFSLNDFETEYFLGLINIERSSNPKLQKKLREQLHKIRKDYDLSVQSPDDEDGLNSFNQFIFYSDWQYSAVRLLTALPEFQKKEGPERIALHLKIPVQKVRESLQFLLNAGLCEYSESGGFQRTAKDTLINQTSPMIDRHLLNYRMKACEELGRSKEPDLFHTSPLVMTAEKASAIKEKIRALIKSAQTASHESGTKALHCLNIDWFEF